MKEKLLTIIYYRGKRHARTVENPNLRVDRIEANESGEFPTPLKHYVLHSPDGFNWGYGGSGPGDLALAILLDYFHEAPTDDDLWHGIPKATSVYHAFKHEVVAGWDDEWEITQEEIAAWMDKPEQQRRLESHEKAREAYDAINEEYADGN